MIEGSLKAGKVCYWALIISVAAHSATLAVFTGVKMSGRIDHEADNRSVMNLQMVEQAVSQPLPKPKPRVEPIVPVPAPKVIEQPTLIADAHQPQPAEKPFEPVENKAEEPVVEQAPIQEVEFFGQKSLVRRICYVVDCSGSMYGRMYLVRDQLKKSILNLNSQQSFCVVFFMKGRQVRTTGGGMLKPATALSKSRALELIESIRPSGSTDAEHALEQSMRLKDAHGNGAEVVYFLSDGFDLDADSSQRFVRKVEELRNSLVPGALLHTIGFEPQPGDRTMLQTLAVNTGGAFIEVK